LWWGPQKGSNCALCNYFDLECKVQSLTPFFASGTTLHLDGGGYKDFDYRAIVNQGIVTWSSG